jgi:hypothetical protein
MRKCASPKIMNEDTMRSKKETRSLLPGVRRLLLLLANAHPMVIATAPTGEKYYARGIRPTED